MSIPIQTIGLKKYLNQTAAQHNGYKYLDFTKQVEAGMSKTALATMFGVTRWTVNRWVALYEDGKR